MFAAESRSARFSGARNKSLHHAPHPAVVPVPYSHRHRRAKFWRPDSKSFCRFCAAAVPRDRQTGSRGISRSALIQTSLRFVCRAVCDAQKTEKRREFSGQDVQLYNRARTAIRLPPGQGCAPTPRQRLTAREKFRVPLTVPELVKQKIAGPRASGVGSDFVIDDGTRKTLGMVVGVTGEANHLQDSFCCSQNRGESLWMRWV